MKHLVVYAKVRVRLSVDNGVRAAGIEQLIDNVRQELREDVAHFADCDVKIDSAIIEEAFEIG